MSSFLSRPFGRVVPALLAGTLLWLAMACGRQEAPAPDPITMEWSAIETAARGQAVTMAMWMGDPYINSYMRDYVAVELEKRYGVRLNIVGAQGGQIVSAIMTEKEAGTATGAYDLVWINGETFYQLRQIEGLYGPFTEKLPNAAYIDFDNPFIGIDFQQPIDGYECPWGNVQMALIYNSERVAEPPRTRAALAEWVAAHPGRFTFDSSFTGMTLLKSWMIDLAGGPEHLAGPFSEERYREHSAKLWAFVNEIKPNFWREGRSFPSSVAQMHQMFANGELDFTMSNNDGEVDNKVLQGLFPETARAFVFEGGTIQNSHYLGIVANAPNKAGALTVINFMISPEAQLEKQDPAIWGDGTVLALDRLPQPWPERFLSLPNRRFAPPRAEIQDKALMELAPEYMIRLYDDFRREVLGE
ncbi:ABC transporter substrate-binding protein [Sulfidibacter corallicola]|uniref:ABC transporter substrate-binding protein n=1 Tax=Sulfidibacter corallicola TaxID=2818388 RepID=A0A8A4U1N6_SULCO|nr:ABC transporter substrate-binding protein [Sulfidibacter corallicola]QTD52645.1 ABC transporter substrate-binding protein [Sulfidibacter corallicola]